MADTIFWSRLQFAFTITYHYLFPQLTMGLAWFLVYFKWKHLRTGDERFGNAARFWARIFGINFAVGVVTGIPMEFQFGTNWAEFSKFSGNIIGQTLAMEGMFAFFLESAMIGAMVWGEKRLGPRTHFLATVGVALGSWLSGYFILATNAFMQHPVGYSTAADGSLRLASFSSFLLNPWAMIMFLHNQCAALVTGSFVVTAVGALYALRGKHPEQASLFLKTGTLVGLVACLLVAFPTGDQQAKMVAKHQPVTLAAMEGHFHSGTNAELNFIGQPDVAKRRIDNRIYMPDALSFLAFGHIHAKVQGLDDFPKDEWPRTLNCSITRFTSWPVWGPLFILLMGIANFPTLARTVGKIAWPALGVDVGVSVSLHRHDGGLDDRGIGPATLVNFPHSSHRPGRQRCRERWKCFVHADWFHRALFRAGRALSVHGRTRNRPRPAKLIHNRPTGGVP